MGKVLPFPCPMHLLCCTERFQRRAGNINHFVFSCTRGRRYLVVLSTCTNLKIGKQVFCLLWVKCSHRIPSPYMELQETLPATSWKPELLRFQLRKRATLPRRPLHLQTIKDRQTGICLPWVKCCRLHAVCIYRVAINASSDELEASIAAFSVAKEGDVASSPFPLVNT